MLKFNCPLHKKLCKRVYDLNTSYVKVQLEKYRTFKAKKQNLNTSYVKVQLYKT